MKGSALRLIRKRGSEYTIRNASGGGGGRDTPSYSDDGTLVGTLERRSRTPQVVSDSSGEDIESTLEIRALPGDSATIREAGSADGYPTKLVHPGGPVYEVVAEYPEDSGVTVLTVVRD